MKRRNGKQSSKVNVCLSLEVELQKAVDERKKKYNKFLVMNDKEPITKSGFIGLLLNQGMMVLERDYNLGCF